MRLAELLQPGKSMAQLNNLMPIRTRGSKPPLFVVHGEPLKIAFRIQAGRPVYGVSALYHPDLARQGAALPETVAQYAALYLEDIRQMQPHGPYFLCGYSAGGMIAFDMARQLLAAGESIGNLTLVEPTVTELDFSYSASDKVAGALDYYSRSTSKIGALLFMLRKFVRGQLKRLQGRYNRWVTDALVALKRPLPEDRRWTLLIKYLRPVIHRYAYPVLNCRVTLVYGLMDKSVYTMWDEFWSQKLLQPPTIISLESAWTHLQLMEDPSLGRIVEILDQPVAACREA